MPSHPYILEPYKGIKSRYLCPNCQHRRNTFSRYIDTHTGSHLHPDVGKCDREIKCGYHYAPRQYFQDNISSTPSRFTNAYSPAKRHVPTPVHASTIPFHLFTASHTGLEANHFIQYLVQRFGEQAASKVIGNYLVGSSGHWPGATVFWQMDKEGQLRAGKIMLYNRVTGKRVKEPFNHITWVHTVHKLPDFVLGQCLFGEQLLRINKGTVAIVESEKTAIIASIYLPQFIWLAVGSLSNLSAEKCTVLKDWEIILFPDLNGYDKWCKKASEIPVLAHACISRLLEDKAREADRANGYDLADYLIGFDHKGFALPVATPVPLQPVVPLLRLREPEPFVPINCKPSPYRFGRWPIDIRYDNEIAALEAFFASTTLPEGPIKINHYSTILNVERYVEADLVFAKANNGYHAVLPGLDRLQELKEYLTRCSPA